MNTTDNSFDYNNGALILKKTNFCFQHTNGDFLEVNENQFDFKTTSCTKLLIINLIKGLSTDSNILFKLDSLVIMNNMMNCYRILHVGTGKYFSIDLAT